MAKHKHPPQAPAHQLHFREWRKWARLSLEDVAKRMGISGAQLSKQETGQRKRVSLDFLEKFALAVGCSPWDPIAGPPGTLAQIGNVARELKPDDLELILGIMELLRSRAG